MHHLAIVIRAWRQLTAVTMLPAGSVLEALCQHFGVKDERQLGYGSVDKLLEDFRSPAPTTEHGEEDGSAVDVTGSTSGSDDNTLNLDGVTNFAGKSSRTVHSWPALALSRPGEL